MALCLDESLPQSARCPSANSPPEKDHSYLEVLHTATVILRTLLNLSVQLEISSLAGGGVGGWGGGREKQTTEPFKMRFQAD